MFGPPIPTYGWYNKGDHPNADCECPGPCDWCNNNHHNKCPLDCETIE